MSIKNSEVRELKYVFTDEELKQKSNQLARLNLSLDSLAEQKKEAASSIAAQVAETNTKIGALSKEITNGYIYREVECEIRYNSPREGLKEFIRRDTHELVGPAEEMSFAEMEATRQLELPLPEGETAEGGEATAEPTTDGAAPELPMDELNAAISEGLPEGVTAEVTKADVEPETADEEEGDKEAAE